MQPLKEDYLEFIDVLPVSVCYEHAPLNFLICIGSFWAKVIDLLK